MAAQHQIERLLGETPGRLTARLAEFAKDGITVPSSDHTFDSSIEVIKKRPDVRLALAELRATSEEALAAEADRWPKISLAGFFGVQDGSSGLRLADNPVWSAASAASLPLLNFGRLRGLADAADARSKAAALRYENTVLIAMQEAQTAITDYSRGVEATRRQEEVLKERSETVALIQERFQRGLTDMTSLTTAQAELDQATIALIDQKAATAGAFVRVQKSLAMGIDSI
jgi:outer membrane protein TolC